jgi:type VI secretion system protein ImpB
MPGAGEGSVAPKERVNIVYKSAIGDMQEEVELPFKTLVVGDFTGKEDETPLEERSPISVDKENFDEVLEAQDVGVNLAVQDRLGGDDDPEARLAVDLKFQGIRDFEPDAIIEQVPEMKKMMELREALTALKGPMGNVPAFRRKVQELVQDESARERLLKELKLDEEQSE